MNKMPSTTLLLAFFLDYKFIFERGNGADMIKNFNLFGKEFSAYMIISLLGYFISGCYACYKFKKRGYDENNMIIFYLVISIGVLLGGHTLYGLTNFRHFAMISFESLRQFVDSCVVIFGGAVFYGGLTGGMFAGLFYLKKKKYDMVLYTDVITPCIPLFHIFGRLGCFFSGCCYGIECNFGIVYHNSLISKANGVRRFPVQWLEIFLNVFLFFYLDHLDKQDRKKGKLLIYYLFIYAFARFFIEFLRGDEHRGFILLLSTSQIISVLILSALSVFTIYKKIVAEKSKQDSDFYS